MFTEPPRSAETHACAGRARVVNLFCYNRKYSTAVDTTAVYTRVLNLVLKKRRPTNLALPRYGRVQYYEI